MSPINIYVKTRGFLAVEEMGDFWCSGWYIWITKNNL